MNVIQTKYGVFGVEDNGNGGAKLYVGNNKVMEFPKLNWWNSDSLNDAIELNIETIRNNEKKQRNVFSKEDAINTLEELTKVLGNEGKGFYSSRLKQCINKLKAA